MTEKTLIKDPDAVLDYAIDWGSEWLCIGESINSYIITVDTGLTKDSNSEVGGIITMWLSGGTAEEDYVVACKIVTSAGRTEERSILIRCRER